MTVIHLRRTTKNDSCCELFTRSVRKCESNSDNAAYSDKLWSWRWFLWLRHNTINWRSNQCCWQPDTRKCINYLKWHLNWKCWQDTVDFGKFSSTPVDRLFSTAGHWTEQSATPQPSEWLDVWETFATESKSQFVLEMKVLYWHYCYLMALILQPSFDANCMWGCLYYCACIFVLLWL